MSEPRTVLVSSDVHIDTAQIPAHVAMNLAQVVLMDIQTAYANPIIQADYQRWKAARAAARGKEVNAT